MDLADCIQYIVIDGVIITREEILQALKEEEET
jgi:hypothetical protein